MQEIRERIKEKMLEQKMNANQLSKISGVPKSVVYRFLSGETVPTIKNLAAMSKVVGCKLF